MSSYYDSALSQIGQDGRFQIKFGIIYNVLLDGLWVMAYNNIILALTVIPHWCKVPQKPANQTEYSWKLKYIPTIGNTSGVEKFSDCLIYINQESNETKACHAYEYDTTWFESTVPSDNSWVCEKELYVANIFAYSKIAEIIGSFFFGWFGDVYGRKLTYIISLTLLVVGRLISVLASSSVVLFSIGCIVAYFPSWSAVQSTAIIALEISSPKRRATVAQLKLVASSIGMCIMPLIYWWFKNWKPFLILTTATQLPFLFLSWKLIESPQWLWINKKSKQCIKTLKRIAKTNKTELSSEIELEILTSDHVVSNNIEVLGPFALFSGWRIAISTMLQQLIWISVSVNYTMVLMSSAEKSDGNPFLEFAWQSLAEVPGHFVAAWLANRIGRRYTGMISSFVTITIWAIYCFREISFLSWLKHQWLSTFLVICNRLSITVSYYLINLLNMELYPTCLRQSGLSFGNVISSGASALAPYILYLGRRFDARYSYFIMIVITTLGGFLSSYLLPETLNTKLPETLEDAQRFGARNTPFNAPVNKDENTEMHTCGADYNN